VCVDVKGVNLGAMRPMGSAWAATGQWEEDTRTANGKGAQDAERKGKVGYVDKDKEGGGR